MSQTSFESQPSTTKSTRTPTNSGELVVKAIDQKSELDAFIDLPYRLYADDPVWVPQLKLAVKDVLDVNKNPFFKHAYLRPFLALRNGQVVGRIAGILDHSHNQYHKETTAFFGFFECIDDATVARALFDKVKEWAREWGMTKLRGPCSPSTNHECGLLVDGFEDPPMIMMPYNFKYYPALIEQNGFAKSMDLLAYHVSEKVQWDPRIEAHAERIRTRKKIVFREFNPRKFDQEIETLADIYNDAWESNWGFVPMTREEFRHMAKEMKPIFDPTILFFAEIDGKPAGFGMALPDVNQIFIKIRDGKLLPFGLLKLLWHLKGPFRKKTVTRSRLLTLGIRKEYQHLGLGALFYMEYQKRVPKKYPYTEASWILENNIAMNKALVGMGAKLTRRYRLYDGTI